MKLYEAGTITYVILALSLGFVYYRGYTADEINQKQKKVVEHYKTARPNLIDAKERYMDKFEECHTDAGEWKDTRLCQTMKDVHPDAVEAWGSLKKLDNALLKANATVNDVKKTLRAIEQLQTTAQRLSNVAKGL